MNTPNLEQLANAQKVNAEAMTALMRTVFNGVERLTAINIAASREFFNNAVTTTQQLMGAKDASELAKVNSELAKPSIEKWVDYSRSVYDLAAQVQKEITSVMEAQYSSFAKSATSVVEKASASAPVGGDVFATTMNSILDASSKAFDSMTAMAKQFSDIAEANLEAATSATTKATSATSAAAKKSAAK